MVSETVKIVLMGAVLLGLALLLWGSLWALIWGERNGEEHPMPTEEDSKRLEEMMSSRFGKDWREKIIEGKI